MSICPRLLSRISFILLAQSLFAQQQPPVLHYFWPDADVLYVSEGQPLTYHTQFSDDRDPNFAQRGMSNVVWLVDGVVVLETTNGAPGTVTSEFVFCADYSTVTAGEERTFEIRTRASDLQGGFTEWACRVIVTNAIPHQTLVFLPLPEKTLGDADFSPGATSSSGLPVSYESSDENVAQIVDGMIHLVGAGVTCIVASQAGDADFLPAESVSVWLTVKVRLSVEVLGGGGEATGTGSYMPATEVELTAVPAAGFYFQQWENGSHALSRRLVMPTTNVQVTARFTTEVPVPELGAIGSQAGMVGVPFCFAVPIVSDCKPTVKVAGLPLGLAYNAGSRCVEGVPRAACSNRLVLVTVTNPNLVSCSRYFEMTISPLPSWLQGVFDGSVGAFSSYRAGLATLHISGNGKVSGKLKLGNKTLPFSTDHLNYWDGHYGSSVEDPCYWLSLNVEDGDKSWHLYMEMKPRDVSPCFGITCPAIGYVRLEVTELGPDGSYLVLAGSEMRQNVWSVPSIRSALNERYVGYYTATLPGCADYGSGYLTLTVNMRGRVMAAGKLADGTAISLSGQLALDATGLTWAALHTSPPAYQGGSFFGVVEWVKPDDGPAFMKVLDGPVEWTSRNPRATAEYGAGFSRSLGLSGGWYGKFENLYNYYRNKELSLATDSEAATPILQAGTNDYESVCWRPDGIFLSAVLNARGEMAGLTAPKPTPLVPTEGGSGNNAVRLTSSLKRATGLFKGAFCMWFDDERQLLCKRVSYEGVLTPVREVWSDGVEGRGFFLWETRGQRENGFGCLTTYPLKESYDLRLLSQPNQ